MKCRIETVLSNYRILILLILFSLSSFCSSASSFLDSLDFITNQEIQSNSTQLIPQLLEELNQTEKDGNYTKEAKVASVLSLAYYYSGDYEANKKYSLKAIQLYEDLKDLRNLSREYGELGYRLKDIDIRNAEFYMYQGIQIAERGNFSEELIGLYNNFGVIKRILNQQDSALIYHQKSIEISLRLNDSVGLPYSLNNVGTIFLLRDDFSMAEKYFNQAKDIRLALNDMYGISDSYAYLGDLFSVQKEYYQAIENFRKSLQIAEQQNITNLMQYNYKNLSECYKNIGDYKNALLYADRRQTFGDSILNVQTNSKIVEYQIQFETAKKEKQILEQEIAVRKRNMLIFLLSILAITIIVIAILIYRNLKIKNTQQRQAFELQEAKMIIDTQRKLEEQRLHISRDLHDNIGSQLTFIIRSIENLKFALKITDDKVITRIKNISNFTRDTITDLRDTIWAMNHSAIDFKTIESRITNFLGKASETTEGIEIQFYIDERLADEKFSSEQGMNIYRIVQEAVHNALKYAEARQITIDIRLQENSVLMKVTDNGIGFDIQQKSSGNGLNNMKKRAKLLNGDIAIKSVEGETVITCLFPLQV